MKFAIIGATGNVGRKTIDILEKSKIEIKNTIKSHIYDGSALTKFLFWLKKNYI